MRKSWGIIGAVTLLALIAVSAWWLWIRDVSNNTATSPAGESKVTEPSTNPPLVQRNNTPKTYQIQVYFSKHPQSDNDPSATFAVIRKSDDLGLARAAITELLKGPSVAEISNGYFSTVQLRQATSICNAADFTVHVRDGIATLQFCKPFDHRGVVADGQADSELKATLRQFASVRKVVILNTAGNCEFDLSGMNLCKE